MIGAVERALTSSGLAPGVEPRLLARAGAGGPDEAVLFTVWGESRRPLAVAKVARTEPACRLLAAEWRNLRALDARQHGDGRCRLPRPLAYEESGGTAVLLQSWLPGRRLKDVADRRLRDRAARRAARWLIEFNRDGRARGGEARVDRYLELFELPPAESRQLRSLAARLAELFPGGVPRVPGHGDFCDANILVEGEAIAILDWEHLESDALPGADLFHLLASLSAPARSLGRAAALESAFLATFFRRGAAAGRARALWQRYREALGLPAEAAFPLFLASWVAFACRKVERLLAAGRRPDQLVAEPQTDYPLIHLAAGGCLNVSLALRHRESFALA